MFLFSSISYGAVSEDMNVYVRQDVFDAKMEALFFRLHGEIENSINMVLGEVRALSVRMDALEKRMTSLETLVTWILGLLSVVVAAIALTPVLREISRPRFTLDDVRRLIEENNARLNTSPQA